MDGELTCPPRTWGDVRAERLKAAEHASNIAWELRNLKCFLNLTP